MCTSAEIAYISPMRGSLALKVASDLAACSAPSRARCRLRYMFCHAAASSRTARRSICLTSGGVPPKRASSVNQAPASTRPGPPVPLPSAARAKSPITPLYCATAPWAVPSAPGSITSGLSELSSESDLQPKESAAAAAMAHLRSLAEYVIAMPLEVTGVSARMLETKIQTERPNTRRRELNEVVHRRVVPLRGDLRIPTLELRPGAEVASR